ncbi:hydantoinase/oxoprolinase family protein [Dendrosporobacter sp. 1207_IL3150]|uniref:hydantoinase/oxoprolinase family protein n=1 Tax=Dendrosporobacter sp. 1207_IL3150 TaxID=3084054 RepID=UPI002FDB39A8
MLLGIDVGGTFTDAVIIKNSSIIKHTKKPTTHGRLLDCIVTALDDVLADINSEVITRVALSTTIATNAIIENNIDKVGLMVIPGPGADLSCLFPVKPVCLSGYTDHRGREVSAVSDGEIGEAFRSLSKQGCEIFAISGKFAVRSPRQELQVAEIINKQTNAKFITLGSSLTGGLNFWRRTNSAYFNSAIWRCFNNFAQAVELALKQRNVFAPVFILKADGGTIPLEVAKKFPVETIFTGPAASVLGIMAMTLPEVPTVSLDIGGTTTDISLWNSGVPLFERKGIKIADYPTSIRAFRIKSIGVGGDSYVRWENGKLEIGPNRLGPAMALGGSSPTVTDALIVAGAIQFGDKKQAQVAMGQIAGSEMNVLEASNLVISCAVSKIHNAIITMVKELDLEPVYCVDDIVSSEQFKPRLIIGIGGAASGLVPYLANIMDLPYQIPCFAPVVNAVGAAIAKPTLEVNFRADTEQGVYTVAELGIKENIPSRRFGMSEAYNMTSKYLYRRAEQAGISVDETEIVHQEEFNLVRGFSTVGQILTCHMQIKPGVLTAISEMAEVNYDK